MSETAATPTVTALICARWRRIAVCALLAWCAAAVLIAARPATYESEAKLRIGAAIRVGADALGPLPALTLLEERTELLSRLTADLPASMPSPRYPAVRVSPFGQDMVRLVARAPTPAGAQTGANRAAEAVVARHARVFSDWKALEQPALTALQDELSLLDARVRNAGDPAEQVRLAKRRTVLAGRLALFQRLQASPQVRMTKIGHEAELPRHAVSPNAAQILAAATLLGAISGIVLALLPGLGRPRP